MKKQVKEWVRDHSPKSCQSDLSAGLSIGTAAKITGLSESSLRKYEAAGLVIFDRTESGHRRLSQEDLIRINLIQHFIKNKGLNLEGIRRLWALIPCWELKECSQEARSTCPVQQGANDPCWTLFSEEGGCDGLQCRSCEVYRMSASCTEDIKGLMLNLLVSKKTKKTNHRNKIREER